MADTTQPNEKLYKLRERLSGGTAPEQAPKRRASSPAAQPPAKAAAAEPASAAVPVTLPPSHGDGFALAAQASAGSGSATFIGDRLKFIKGDWVVGRHEAMLPDGARLITLNVAEAWCHFTGGQMLIETIRRVPNEPFPTRDQLGDDDPSTWVLGPSGQPADPWCLSSYLHLRHPDNGADLTFVTSSATGRVAVQRLAREIVWRRSDFARLDVFPIVELGTGSFVSRKFGAIAVPKFTIVAWVDSTGRPVEPEDKLNDENPY